MSSRVLTQFGLRDQPADYWINQNPNLKFIGLKQTHSDVVLDISSGPHWTWPAGDDGAIPEGDGLITDKKNMALVIASADCLPILIHDPGQNRIAALHAGWRGVANRIFPKSISSLSALGGNPREFQIWIGPHIQAENFEVGLDVAEKLFQCTPDGSRAERPHSDPDKACVDLNELIRLQAHEFQITPTQLFFDPRNTFTDARLPSYRRDGPRAGRMLSWITLLT